MSTYVSHKGHDPCAGAGFLEEVDVEGSAFRSEVQYPSQTDCVGIVTDVKFLPGLYFTAFSDVVASVNVFTRIGLWSLLMWQSDCGMSLLVISYSYLCTAETGG